MAFSLKHQKEIEADIHEQLYSNIYILTLMYPTTKEFNAHFKKDMFIKNNKTAFQHVMHFLLNILDPTIFKQKTIIWPLLDVKMELQFRNEIMKYLNELNSTNKETGIPLIMTSHLISPGGYKFAEFMFRLSQYVLSEHIKHDKDTQNCVIFPPNANNDYNISSEQVHIITKIVDDQYNMLVQKQMQFLSNLDYAKTRSNYIIGQKNIHYKSAEDIEEKINEFLKFSESDISKIYEKSLPEREEIIEENLNKLNEFKLHFKECLELVDILNENKNVVKLDTIDYNNEDTVIDTYKYNKDLIEHFKSLLITLKNNKYLLKIRKDPNLLEYVQITSEISNDLHEYNNKYEELITEFQMFKSEIELNSNEFYKNCALSEKIREIFQVITPLNIYTHN